MISHLDDLFEVVLPECGVTVDSRWVSALDRCLDDGPVGRDDERCRRYLEEETDGLEDVDDGVIEAAIEVVDQDNGGLHVVQSVDEGFELDPEVRDGLENDGDILWLGSGFRDLSFGRRRSKPGSAAPAAVPTSGESPWWTAATAPTAGRRTLPAAAGPAIRRATFCRSRRRRPAAFSGSSAVGHVRASAEDGLHQGGFHVLVCLVPPRAEGHDDVVGGRTKAVLDHLEQAALA